MPRGDDVDAPNGLGWTALHIAANIGDLRLVNLLLDAGSRRVRFIARARSPTMFPYHANPILSDPDTLLASMNFQERQVLCFGDRAGPVSRVHQDHSLGGSDINAHKHIHGHIQAHMITQASTNPNTKGFPENTTSR